MTSFSQWNFNIILVNLIMCIYEYKNLLNFTIKFISVNRLFII
jgi:hypothetical protein